jgi:hypothetical protein
MLNVKVTLVAVGTQGELEDEGPRAGTITQDHSGPQRGRRHDPPRADRALQCPGAACQQARGHLGTHAHLGLRDQGARHPAIGAAGGGDRGGAASPLRQPKSAGRLWREARRRGPLFGRAGRSVRRSSAALADCTLINRHRSWSRVCYLGEKHMIVLSFTGFDTKRSLAQSKSRSAVPYCSAVI